MYINSSFNINKLKQIIYINNTLLILKYYFSFNNNSSLYEYSNKKNFINKEIYQIIKSY